MISNLESDGDNNKPRIPIPVSSSNASGLNSKDVAQVKLLLERFP